MVPKYWFPPLSVGIKCRGMLVTGTEKCNYVSSALQIQEFRTIHVSLSGAVVASHCKGSSGLRPLGKSCLLRFLKALFSLSYFFNEPKELGLKMV